MCERWRKLVMKNKFHRIVKDKERDWYELVMTELSLMGGHETCVYVSTESRG
jgi:hypothetical protein